MSIGLFCFLNRQLLLDPILVTVKCTQINKHDNEMTNLRIFSPKTQGQRSGQVNDCVRHTPLSCPVVTGSYLRIYLCDG